MFITIGVGNTNTVIGLIDDRILYVYRKPTVKLKTTSDFKDLLNDVFSQYNTGTEKPEGSILASVIPELTKSSVHALSGFTGAEPLIVDAHIHTKLDFSDYSGLLGSDRIAICAAAWNRSRSPCIVIDIGTAITFNLIGMNAFFLGGAILPGLRVGLEALSRNTAQFPDINLKEPPGVIGHNTEGCLLSGAYYGTTAMVDGMIKRMMKTLNQKTKVFLTGGGAGAILPLLETKVDYKPDLLLEGLAVLYHENTLVKKT